MVNLQSVVRIRTVLIEWNRSTNDEKMEDQDHVTYYLRRIRGSHDSVRWVCPHTYCLPARYNPSKSAVPLPHEWSR